MSWEYLALIFVALVATTLVWIYYQKPKVLDYHGFAESKFIEVDGLKIHYVQEGRGPHLLLVHGLGSSIYCWRFIFKQLTQYYSVTALDLPGFGLSEKNSTKAYNLESQTLRLKSFLDQLGIVSTHIVAHSMGSFATAWLCHIHPEKVNKVVFIAPALNHKLVKANIPSLVWLAKLTKNKIVTPALVRWLYYKRALNKPPADAEVAAHQYYLPYHRSHEAVLVFLKYAETLKDRRISEALFPFSKPALVLVAGKDRVIKPYFNQQFLKNNNLPTAISPYSGHQLMEEDPDFVTENIKNFFDT